MVRRSSFIWLILFSALFTITAQAQTTLAPAADAYIEDGAAAATNFGTATELKTQTAANPNRETYLKFDLTNVGSLSTVKLRLFGRLSDTSSLNLATTVYTVSDTTWTESGLTWNTKPAAGASLGSVTVTDDVARWYEWNITAYVQAERMTGRNVISLVVKNPTTSANYTIFNSKEAAGNAPQLVATGEINYTYDELGRLAAVSDPAGDTAVYKYDAVGNLLAISRHSSNSVAVIEFSPDSGAIGSSVTIYGTGFSATVGQNTVTFNGVAAVVTSATTTQLVTSVPAGATTGPIAVTSPNGSATSSTAFTITGTTNGVPTITSFSPTIGTIGTAVSITGTNYEPTLANNRVTFNITRAAVTSGTTTQLVATVPALSGSGRISLATPAGQAVSTADFFIPPAPYTAPEVEFTGRMTFGESKVVTLNTANKIGLILFDGTAGGRVSIERSNVTVTTSDLAIYNPDGTLLTKASNLGSTGGYAMDTDLLPLSGTYAIMVDPASSYTGSMTIKLNDASDVVGTITPGGPAVTVTTTVPGQNGRLTFNGTAGQRVSLILTNVTNGTPEVKLIAPDGTTVVRTGGATTFIDATVLPATGVYTIIIDRTGANTGSCTVTLYNVPPDVSGTITPGGSSVTVTITTPGQNAQLTFSGTASQRVSMRCLTVNTGFTYFTISKPDGTTLVSTSGSSCFIEPQTLATAGTYSILLNPNNTDTGDITIALYDVPADVSGAITPNGPAVTVSITTPGQNASLTFTGTAGRKISLRLTNKTISSSNLKIYKPDETTLISTDTASSFIDAVTLPTTGTYRLFLDPVTHNTGNITFTLYEFDDITDTITPGGAAVTVTTTAPGQDARLTFSGTAGQRVSLNLTNVTITTKDVSILKPDGTTLVTSTSNFLGPVTLATTGTYTVLLDPRDIYTGSATLTLYDVVDVTGTITIGGPAVPVTLNTPGQIASLTFDGTTGQQVTVRVTGNTMGSTSVKLLRPDGTTLASYSASSSSFNLPTKTLDVTGTYKITIDPSGPNTGSMNVTVTSP